MTALSDLRLSWRALRKRPTYMFAAGGVLAMLIAATTVVFTAVNAILLRPLPVRDARALVALCEFTTKERDPFCVSTPPNTADIRASTRAFTDVGIGRDWPLTLRTVTGGEGVPGGLATPDFFRTLGVTAATGRLFAADEIGPGARVAVVSETFARQRFGSRDAAVGKAMILDNQLFTIVGVLGAETRIPTLERVSVWVPLPFDLRNEENRAWRGFKAFARLAPGVTVKAAREALAASTSVLHRDHFADNGDWRIEMVPAQDLVVGSVRRGLTMLFVAVGLVVLIGCANLANLILARTAQRRSELSLRVALGASPAALVRVVLAEGAILALLGVGVGIPAAAWLTDGLRTLAPAALPRAADIRFDLTAALFAVALGALIAGIVGVLPGLLARRVNVRGSLVEGTRVAVDARAATTARTLVGVQLAVAAVLLTGGIVLGRSLATLSRWQPGFPTDRTVSAWLAAPSERYATGADAVRAFERVADEVRAVPGVDRVALVSAGPLFGGLETGSAARADAPRDARGTNVRWFDVSSGYFETVGRRLVRGRDFGTQDVEGAPPVAVISERLAAILWGNDNPIGKRLRLDASKPSEFEVVGVVSNQALMNPSSPPEPEMYWSNRQIPRWGTFVVIRTAKDPSPVIRGLKERVDAVDRELQVGKPVALSDLAERELVVPRFATVLVASFTAMALAIAAVGLFGLQAYAVSQRRREFGVRVALGASPSAVRWFVLRQGLRTGAVALLVGIPLAQLVARPLGSLLAGVTTHDPLTLAAVVVTLAAVALVGSVVPARRAARLEPMDALRSD